MTLDEGPETALPPRQEPMSVPPAHGWFRRAVLASAGAYGETVLVGLIINLLALAVPLVAIVAFDQIVPQFNAADNLLWHLGVGVALIFGVDFILRMLRSHFTATAGGVAMAQIEDQLFPRMLSAKLADRVTADTGMTVLGSALEDLRGMLAAGPILGLIDLLFIVLFILACYLIGGPVALIPLIAVPTVLFVSLVLQLPLRSRLSRARSGARQRLQMASEALNGLETVKTVGSEDRMLRIWETFTTETQRDDRKAQSLAAWIGNLTAVAGNLVLVCVIAYGAYRVYGQQMSVGGLVASALLAAAAMAPLDRYVSTLSDYYRGRTAMDVIDSLMRIPAERPEGAAYTGPSVVEGAIAFQNVTFRYPQQSNLALDGVSFQVEAGEKVALIGRIGAGKSSILRMVLGLYAPEGGLVAVDGLDVAAYDPASLRANIGCVPQDVQLFDGTLAENIALAVPTIGDEMISRAARIAGVDTIAEVQAAGFDMPIGARGHALSGGERQALSFARALVCDPPILLLDEPTSSLDNTSEGRLRARLANAMGDKTLLLVTNRASMLSLVDRVIVLDGGRIVADGPKQEVLDGLQGGLIHGALDVER